MKLLNRYFVVSRLTMSIAPTFAEEEPVESKLIVLTKEPIVVQVHTTGPLQTHAVEPYAP